MSIQDQFAAKTTVVEIAGKVTIGPDAKMRDAILEATDAGAQNVLLNMTRVTKLDSSGVGELAAAHLSITKQGGRLLLVGLPDKVSEVLRITNLLGIIETYPNIDEALTALENPSDKPQDDSV